MAIESIAEQDLPSTATATERETQEAIDRVQAAAAGTTLSYLNISVTMTVRAGSDETTEKLAETNNVVELVIPYDMFNGLSGTYSLVSVVAEHLKMLLDAGVHTKVLVSEDCPDSDRRGVFADERLEWVRITNRLNSRRIVWHDYSQPDGELHEGFFAEADAIAADLIRALADVDVCMPDNSRQAAVRACRALVLPGQRAASGPLQLQRPARVLRGGGGCGADPAGFLLHRFHRFRRVPRAYLLYRRKPSAVRGRLDLRQEKDHPDGAVLLCSLRALLLPDAAVLHGLFSVQPDGIGLSRHHHASSTSPLSDTVTEIYFPVATVSSV